MACADGGGAETVSSNECDGESMKDSDDGVYLVRSNGERGNTKADAVYDNRGHTPLSRKETLSYVSCDARGRS